VEIIAIRLPILILGLNGVPGFALFRHFNKLYGSVTVSGNAPSKASNAPGVIGVRPIKHPCVFGENVFGVDAEETERLGELFEKFRFGTVIDASGNCALKACECDPARSRLLNYSQGVDAATFAARYNATLIRISADMVFSGD
jgi:dTDP-4-dehydrorhamnose reductase